ncbi:unnamed protein product [Debaryomyces tyrocola]|nr:unnamed protein product [Debaryomyces tyrocola]
MFVKLVKKKKKKGGGGSKTRMGYITSSSKLHFLVTVQEEQSRLWLLALSED